MAQFMLFLLIIHVVCIKRGAFQSNISLTLSKDIVPENETVSLTCSNVNGELLETKWKNSMLKDEEAACVRTGDTCTKTHFLAINDLYDCSCNDDGTFSVMLRSVDRYHNGAVWSCRELFAKSNSVVIKVSVPVRRAKLTGNRTQRENSSTTFSCNTSYCLPIAQIHWYLSSDSSSLEIKNTDNNVHIKRDNYTRDDNLISTEETLTYRVNRSVNSWNVYCNASILTGDSVMSNKITLSVTYPPDGPPNIYDFENGSVFKVIEAKYASLSCSVEGGNPLGKLEWFCNDFNNISKEIITDHKSITANLSWIAERNQGKTCICQSDHVLSKQSVFVNVDVLYPPDIPTIQLEHKGDKNNVTSVVKMIENKSYVLSCIAGGNPKPTTYFWTGPNYLNISTNETLHLSKLQREQNGVYSCFAQNVMTPTYGGNRTEANTFSVNIFTLYKPAIAVLKDLDLAEGSSRNITCEAISANPNKTDVLWTSEGLNFNTSEGLNFNTISNTLTLQNISRYDANNYTCKMNNSMVPTVGQMEEGYATETFYLNVWYKASVEEFLLIGQGNGNQKVANESTEIVFTCVIDSNPNSTVAITLRNGTKVIFKETNIIEYRYLLSSCHDSGIYTCSGSNDYNYGQPASADMNLLVNCKPLVSGHIEEDIRSQLYIPSTLQFTAIAYPEPEFTWEMWNNLSWTQITNNNMFSISSSGLRSNLTINNFMSMEINYFRLIAENMMGKLIQNYTLQPQDRPNQPTEFNYSLKLLTETSITLLWKPGFNGGSPQNFSIKYKRENNKEWDTLMLQDTGEDTMNLTIEGLTSNTFYEFQIFATNIKGSSEIIKLRIQTKVKTTTEGFPVALVSGISSGFIVIVGVLLFGILLYRKRFFLGKKQESGKFLYQNVQFTGKNRKKTLDAKSPIKVETSIHELQELDDAPPIIREPTEYYNSPDKIEQIHSIKVSELLQYVLGNNEESFGTDYQKLPTGLEKPCTFARKPENIALNRFNGIYPYDHSRVTISEQPDFFINACYIHGYTKQNAYIASLGPTEKVTYGFKTFWMMVWNERSDIIVMLTHLKEPSGMKCEQYWPKLGTDKSYGDIQVFCDKEEIFAEYTTRSFTISNADSQRSITHLHYTAWPDKKVPEDVTSLIEFRQRLKATPSSRKGPIVVHCSAGIGRTGTLIALDRLVEEGECEFSVDVFTCVNSMREQRVKMVQTLEQYIYIFKALVNSLYFDCETIPVESFQEYVHETNNNIYSKQFQQLKESVETCNKEEKDARSVNETFVSKNRHGADIPGNQNRVYLNLNRQTDEFDYINAVYVNSFKKKDHFIIAQSPLPDTVSDFVTMIYQEECCCVVTMEDLKEPGNSVGQYLPPDGQTLKFGDIKVSCTTLETKPQYTVREMRIRYNGKYETGKRVSYHFQYNKWMQTNDIPADVTGFVQFIKDVEDYAEQLGEVKSHVLVHCLKANERSALYCLVTILMEKMRYERQVNVLNTVRHLRTRRRSALTSMEQLKFCYKAANAYISMFEE